MPRLLFLACLLLVLPASAEDSNYTKLESQIRALRAAYESRIADLKSQVKDLRSGSVQQIKATNQAVDDALAKKSPADKATDGSLVVQAFSLQSARASSSRVTVGGYTEFSYTDRGNRVPEFSQDRTVLEIGASLADRIKLYIEFEQETGATLEGDNANGGEWEVEQAYLDFNLCKQFTFRAGTMLVPVGRFNLYHEGFINNFVDRPLVNRWVIPTTWYEEGVGAHGDLVDNKSLGINYEMGVYNPAVASHASSDIGFREIRNEGASPAFRGKAGAMRVVFEPARNAKWFADNLELGLSGYISNYSTQDQTDAAGDFFPKAHGALEIEAVDFTYEKTLKPNKSNFGFRAEAANAHVSAGAASPSPLGGEGLGVRGRLAQSAHGFYAEAYYSWKPGIFDKWTAGFQPARTTGTVGLQPARATPTLVFASRFDCISLNEGRADARDLKRLTTGISFRPLAKTVIKLDYQLDFSHSGLTLDQIPDSGRGKRTDAVLFGVATGF